MYTGYFAKLKKYQEAGLVPVSIALKTPDWYTGLEYKRLAPTWSILSSWKYGDHKGDTEYYKTQYKKQVLDHICPTTAVSELLELTKAPAHKIILLCYEKPEDFCHRHLVADWINGIIPFMSICYMEPIEEYTGEKKIIPLSDEDVEKIKSLGYSI